MLHIHLRGVDLYEVEVVVIVFFWPVFMTIRSLPSQSTTLRYDGGGGRWGSKCCSQRKQTSRSRRPSNPMVVILCNCQLIMLVVVVVATLSSYWALLPAPTICCCHRSHIALQSSIHPSIHPLPHFGNFRLLSDNYASTNTIETFIPFWR